MTMQLQFHSTPHPGAANDILPAAGANNPVNMYNSRPGVADTGYYHYPHYNGTGGKNFSIFE